MGSIDQAADSAQAPDYQAVAHAAARGGLSTLLTERRDIIAVGGGKGGIGKSLISSNLGVHLANMGKRVVLIDADLGGANLHTCLGMAPPTQTLSDFTSRRVPQLSAVVAPTPVPNLGLISGAHDMLGAANPKVGEKLRLLQEIAKLDVDCVLIDLGGGTAYHIIDFFLLADCGLIAVVPEPTSVENAYRFVKAACYRRLRALETSWGLAPMVESAMDAQGGRGLKSPQDLIAAVSRRDAVVGERMRAELLRHPFHLVVNQVRTAEEQALGPSISAACRRYFGVDMRFVGAIPYDDAVWQAVRRRQPVVLASPTAPAALQLCGLAGALGLLEPTA